MEPVKYIKHIWNQTHAFSKKITLPYKALPNSILSSTTSIDNIFVFKIKHISIALCMSMNTTGILVFLERCEKNNDGSNN